jgi:DNA-binding CsgD family transcriptional regulator
MAAVSAWEAAYAAYHNEGDLLRAARVARSIAPMYGTIVGDWAVANGWIARAQTLLGPHDATSEPGWVALALGMFEGDRRHKDELFLEALQVASAHGDTELELVTRAYLGASLVHAGRTEEGMRMLDEALAAIAGQEIDDFIVLEEIFCQLFSACEHARDVPRADQWIRVGDVLAERRNLPAVSAFCRTHYGGVLTAAGRWREADVALSEAVRLWGLGRRSGLRNGALVRLADLRVRQGRFEEAEQLLADPGVRSEPGATRPRAAIELARGAPELACHLLEQGLADLPPASADAAPLLSLFVEAHLAAGRPDEAARAADRLAECAAAHRSDYLRASAALAKGRVCLVSGDGDPHACLREALNGFSRAEMPMELARVRLELANALANTRPDVAMAEARAALEAFEQLQAVREADAAAATLRALGVRASPVRTGDDVLTGREREVLELLGRGLSNPEISDRLYISRKTVEHHVGRILAKLHLRSRAEAAAYAARQEQGSR